MLTFPFTLFTGEEIFINEKSILFPGANQHLNMGNNFKFEQDETFSFSWWQKKTNVGNARVIFTTLTGTGSNTIGILVQQDNNATNRLLINFNNSNTNQIRVRYVLGADTFDVWNYLTLTYDGTGLAAGIKVYSDNVLLTVDSVLEDGLAGMSIVNASSDALIGSNSAAGMAFPGNIDEWSFWDKELSVSDISQIYGQRRPGNLKDHPGAANLTTWYRMGDGDTFPTIKDNNDAIDATMINMVSGDIVDDIPPTWGLRSLILDGVNEYVSAPDITAYDVGSEMSVSMWVKATTIQATNPAVFGKGNNQSSQNEFFCRLLAGGQFNFLLSADGAGFSNTFNATAITAGNWHHLVCLLDSGGDLRMYLDGSLDNTPLAHVGGVFNSARDFLIGARESNGSPVTFFDGQVSNVTYYNKGLSAAEVTELFNSGKIIDGRTLGSATAMVAYYQLGGNVDDDATGGTGVMKDISVNLNDGTPFNTEAADIIVDSP